MKTSFKYIAISFSALLTLTACTDSLDQEPKTELTAASIFSDQSHIESNLLGLYSSAKALIPNKLLAINEARGEDFINLSVNSYEAYEAYQMNVGLTTSDNSSTWSSLYGTINNVNTFLANIENAQSAAGSNYAQYVAEAKFIRALAYYYLNDLYAEPYKLDPNAKSVPLRLKAENSTGDNDLARSTVSEVYAQILSDLSDETIASLPTTTQTYDAETRATQAAAHALRQRIYLEEENWQKAVDEGNAIQGYSLEGDPSANFGSSPSSSEVIFTWPMASTNRGGNQTAPAFYFSSGTNFVIDFTSGIYSKPAYSLAADKRIAQLTRHDDSHDQYLSTKFSDSRTYLDWVPEFRYAETLLNNAEAYYQLGDEAHARQALLQVRRRSVAAADDIIDVNSLSGNDLLQAIYNERRLEFLGEGIRSLDLHRRGDTITKQAGTAGEFSTAPYDDGYVFPIPTSERSANKLIED